MEQQWVEVKLKSSVEGAGKDSAVTLCTAEPPWLSPHHCFAEICSSIQRKNSYLEQYVIPCAIMTWNWTECLWLLRERFKEGTWTDDLAELC